MNKKFGINIRLLLIIIGTLFYFFANFHRIAIPGAVFDLLEQDLRVTAPYITAFGAIFMYIYAVNQLINGVLVDRFGGFRVMLGGGLILGLGALLFPLSSNLFIMYFSRGLIGLGSSTFYLSIIRELRDFVSEKNFGMAISVMLFIGYTGGIFANAPFVFAMKYANWRDILVVIAAIILTACIIFSLLLPKVQLPKINKNVKLRLLPFRLVLHKRHNRNLFSFACCNFAIFYTIQTIIGKKFLEDFCFMTTSKSALVLSCMAIIAAFFNIVNAYVCKLGHNHRVQFLKKASIITFSSLLLICTALIFNIRTNYIAVIFCILAANASLTSILVPVLHLTNRKMISGTTVSIMNFCFFTMVGVLSTVTGFLLNIFEPVKRGNITVYSSYSYLLVFGLFFILSMFEMYKAMKLSNKY
jgi:MFS family permease